MTVGSSQLLRAVTESGQPRRTNAGRREFAVLLLCHRMEHTITPYWCPEIVHNIHRAKIVGRPAIAHCESKLES